MGISAAVPVAELPASLFHCQLEKQPDHLVPQHALTACLGEDGFLLNPDCCFTDGRELTSELCASVTEKLALQGPVAWVPHPATRQMQPYWLSHELRAALEDLRSGKASSSDISPDVRESLAMAGVLMKPSDAAAERLHWAERLAKAATHFQEFGYAPRPD